MYSVNGIGRLVKDPELKYTNNGKAVLGFTVASNHSRDREKASFIDCSIFGAFAETMAKYLTKGSQVWILGELIQDHWEKDGQKHSKFKVMVDKLEMIGSKSGTKNEQAPAPGKSESFQDDEIPF